MKINFIEQEKPVGLPDAFILGEKFIGKNNVAMILGDNFFYGQNLSEKLSRCTRLKTGAKIILHKVTKPELFGVAKTRANNNKIIKIFSKELKPSNRGELEITELLKKYQKINQLDSEFIGRGGAWLDTGSIEDYYKTSAFVQAVENRQGLKIACLEEISLLNKWINKNKILNQIKFYGNCEYSDYLKKIINK